MVIDLWSLLLSAKETHRKAQKHTECMQLHSRDIAVTRFGDWNALVQYSAWHGCSTDLAQYPLHWQVIRYRAKLVPCQLALSKQAGPARHGSAWHDVGTLWSCLHCHCYIIVPSRAGTVLTRFQWQCKCSINAICSKITPLIKSSYCSVPVYCFHIMCIISHFLYCLSLV